MPKAIVRFWGSLPMRSIEQGSGSFSLKEDVLIRVRLSYFADPMFYKYVKNFIFYIAEGDGKVHVRKDGVLFFSLIRSI